jgi:phage shock protein C
MTMESSQDKLDKILQNGKITEEDYKQISGAMKKKLDFKDEAVSKTADPRKFFKIWKHREVGGVCAGIGEYFGIDYKIVRIFTVLFAFIALPAVLITYFAMCFMMPWDDEESAAEYKIQRHPLRFALFGMLFTTILPIFLGTCLLPKVVIMYNELGAELPGISKCIITIMNIYWFWGIPLSMIIVIVATLGYWVFQKKKLRLVYSFIFFIFAVSWLLFLVAGTLIPFSGFVEKIG